MSHVAHKRTITSNSIIEKYKILKEVDKDSSFPSVAVISKQTLSNWIKKKKQIYESVDSNSSTNTRHRPTKTWTIHATPGS